ncbi:hypothetical protein C1646_724144 [Rhizophagus diaphanus]|nr:hypothetical protein C1646_724144 [Rhizophagus diaphanus] [Rhizophagus sp. MUCL 43196]
MELFGVVVFYEVTQWFFDVMKDFYKFLVSYTTTSIKRHNIRNRCRTYLCISGTKVVLGAVIAGYKNSKVKTIFFISKIEERFCMYISIILLGTT